MSVCRIKTTAPSFVFLRPRPLYRRSRDNRSSTDIIEKGVKNSAGPNRNRDIFYCHAQSLLVFLFPFSALSLVLVPFLLRRASHRERFVTPGPTRGDISIFAAWYTQRVHEYAYAHAHAYAHMYTIYAAYLEEVEVLPSDTHRDSYDTLLKM